MGLGKFRKDLEAFMYKIMMEYYLNGAGLKETLNIQEIYKNYQHLFSIDAYKWAKRELEIGDKGKERSFKVILSFIVDEHLNNSVKKLLEKYLETESRAIVKVDDEEYTFRYSQAVLANEDSRLKRQQIYEARNNVILEILNPILYEMWTTYHSLVQELGYDNYLELYQDITGIDFIELKSIVDALSSKIEKIYIENMNQLLEENIGIKLKEAEKHDISYIFRAKKFDQVFRKEKMILLLKKFYKGIGVDMDAQKNITLDLEERPKKSPRAFMVPIKVPDDVRLVVLPIGGVDDYRSLFHEAGHLEHYANVDPNLETEFKYLGDNSVTETFAFLSEYMLTDYTWLKDNITMDNYDEFLKFEYTIKAYFIRRYAAKLAYEIWLHSKGLKNAEKVYKETLEKYLIFNHPSEHYLIDLDPGFYVAKYLKAWILEAMLREKLREKFGEKWFLNKKAGDFLIGLWKNGQKYNADEIANFLEYDRLNIEPFYEQLKAVFD